MKSRYVQWLLIAVSVAWSATTPVRAATIRVGGGAWQTFGHISATTLLVEASAGLGGTGTLHSSATVRGSVTPGVGTNTGALGFTEEVTFEGGILNTYAAEPTSLSRIDVAGTVSGTGTVVITRAPGVEPIAQIVIAGAASSDYGSFSVLPATNWHLGQGGSGDLWITFHVPGVYTVMVASVHGTVAPPPGAYVYTEGDVITNRVTSPEIFGTTQYVSTGWALTGHEPSTGNDQELVFTVTNSAVLVWLWSTQYWLAAESGSNGTIDAADGWRDAGSIAEIEAWPDAYYGFSQWSGDASGSINPLNLLMDASKSVTAHFSALYTTNQPTPQWWLAKHGITENVEDAVHEDHDGDEVPTWMEFIMDTDPTNAASFLAVSGIEPAYGTNCWEVVWTNDVPPYEVGTNIECDVIGQRITWSVSTQRVYDVQSAAGLSGEPWTGVPDVTGIAPATDSLAITNPVTGDRYQLYRIEVRLPE